jgi:hypothetical protein
MLDERGVGSSGFDGVVGPHLLFQARVGRIAERAIMTRGELQTPSQQTIGFECKAHKSAMGHRNLRAGLGLLSLPASDLRFGRDARLDGFGGKVVEGDFDLSRRILDQKTT